jgi:hypothetical protein
MNVVCKTVNFLYTPGMFPELCTAVDLELIDDTGREAIDRESSDGGEMDNICCCT